jgi:hypothetical protein
MAPVRSADAPDPNAHVLQHVAAWCQSADELASASAAAAAAAAAAASVSALEMPRSHDDGVSTGGGLDDIPPDANATEREMFVIVPTHKPSHPPDAFTLKSLWTPAFESDARNPVTVFVEKARRFLCAHPRNGVYDDEKGSIGHISVLDETVAYMYQKVNSGTAVKVDSTARARMVEASQGRNAFNFEENFLMALGAKYSREPTTQCSWTVPDEPLRDGVRIFVLSRLCVT